MDFVKEKSSQPVTNLGGAATAFALGATRGVDVNKRTETTQYCSLL